MSNVEPAGSADQARDRILDTVIEILETDGYEGVQLREVARRSRTSLATIYKRYATREELILAALACWMEENHTAISVRGREPGEPLHPAMGQTTSPLRDRVVSGRSLCGSSSHALERPLSSCPCQAC